ncbi:MAG: hypothetical protein IPN71_11600 [Fibrobacteres bacterium]|nr:hypothetical protein [Fibrobacterota bacterium]
MITRQVMRCFSASLLVVSCSESTTSPPLPTALEQVQFDPAPGFYSEGQAVQLSCSIPECEIFYYIQDPWTPIVWKHYTSKIAFLKSGTIHAIAFQEGSATGQETSAQFSIDAGPGPDPVPWDPKVPYGSLTDNRNNRIYRTVQVGSQTWMAENLEYLVSGKSGKSWFYMDDVDSGHKYGRLYDWIAAMGCDSGSECNSYIPKVNVCPEGWRLPSLDDWTQLLRDAALDLRGVGNNPGANFKAAGGWLPWEFNVGGVDAFGFRVLPSGTVKPNMWRSSDDFSLAGKETCFWTSDPDSAGVAAWTQCFTRLDDTVRHVMLNYKNDGNPIRCMKD